MARPSKRRQQALASQTVAAEQFTVVHKTAIYARLSREDNLNSSDSIENQLALLNEYVSNRPYLELAGTFVDNGYTGTDFDRPEWQKLMEAVQAKEVDCIVVKDLSRLGRNYIETGEFLEKICPFFGIRFIAINDGFDTDTVEASGQLSVSLSNIINDYYAKDISRKVSSALRNKMENGDFIGAWEKYGYLKDPNNKNQLIINPETAPVVKQIFLWRSEGMSYMGINKKLNDSGVLSPGQYKANRGIVTNNNQKDRVILWNKHMITEILKDITYLGHLAQRKASQCLYAGISFHRTEEQNWIIVENTHEPIISDSDFEAVQNLLQTDGRVSPESKSLSPFMGLLFCGDCGEQMVRRRVRYKESNKVYYICSTKNRGEGCSRHSIEENTLKELVSIAVRRYANDFLAQSKLFEQAKEKETNLEAVAGCQKELARLKQEQDKYYGLCAGLYDDLRQNVVTKEEFERLHKEFQSKAQELEKAQEQQQDLIRRMLQKGVVSASRLAKFQDSLKLAEIDRHTLTSLVKRIYVYEDKRLEIEFYFQDEYQIMQEYVTALSGQESGRERSA